MKRLSLLVVVGMVLAAVLCLSGCFTHHLAHDRQHVRDWRQDIHALHRSIDEFLR